MSSFSARDIDRYATTYETQVTHPETKPNPNSYGVVKADRLNVRQQPTSQSPILFIITKGTRVEIKNKENDWVDVIVKDGTNRAGFLMRKFIEEI